MKRTLALAVLLLGVAGALRAELHGSWTATTEDAKPGRIHMNIVRGGWNNYGNTMKFADFRGLSAAQTDSTTQVPVQFELAREAGTFQFEGTFKNGHGAGQFTFQGNRDYPAAIRALGVEFDLKQHGKNKGEEHALFSLALMDVSTAFIRGMQAEGYRTTLNTYHSMRIHGASPEFVREMRALGFNLTEKEVISTRIHAVTPEYVRKMRAAGWDLTLKELMSGAIHGATPEFAEEMKRLGYDLSHRDLVQFRIHGVTADFIRELRDAGYKDVPAKKLIQMRIHGIDVAYIKKMNSIE